MTFKSKVTRDSKGRVTIYWNKDKLVTGYKIKIFADGKKASDAKTYTVTRRKGKLNVGKLKKGTLYHVRIRGYKRSSGKNYYGDWTYGSFYNAK